MLNEDFAEDPPEEEGPRLTRHCQIIYAEMKPLIGYAEGGEYARLILKLGRNYFGMRELAGKEGRSGGVKIKSETLSLSGSKPNFLRVYSCVGLLNEFYMKGDIVGSSVNRHRFKAAVSRTLTKKLDVWVSDGDLNHMLKDLVGKYDVFGSPGATDDTAYGNASNSHTHRHQTGKDTDHVRLGYRLKDNVRIVLTFL